MCVGLPLSIGEAMGISHDTEEDDELDELEEMEHTGKPGYFILKGMPGDFQCHM